MNPRPLTAALILLLTTTWAARAVAANPLTVSAAISLKDALAQIAPKYQSTTGDKIQVNVGASGQLMEQIRNGAPVDLFLSAGPGQVEDLEKANLTVPNSRKVIARNRLVLITPAGKAGIATFPDLAKDKVKRIAVGRPKVVPAGDYAAQVFSHFHLADTLKPKLIYGANVRQVLDYVKRGEVDAGVVYATDVPIAGPGVTVAATAPDDSHQPIEYIGVVVKGAPDPAAAGRFLDYLKGPDAREVLKKWGFEVDEPHARLAPYDPDPNHLWNRLQQALFVRTAPDGRKFAHTNDPLLFTGGTFLLEGEPHRQAVALLDEFLGGHGDQLIGDARKRLFLQRDLWAAFDYVAWYPDDWVDRTEHEPAAIALRTRLAKAIGRLALAGDEIDALPDNYGKTVNSGRYPRDDDPDKPGQAFLPADLWDPAGPWVRVRNAAGRPLARDHFDGAGGRAVHVIFLRLPGGRAATEAYVKGLRRGAVPQFPVGTMAAMVRRALAVDRVGKLRVTPVTESVQVRVYRRIPADPRANFHGDFGEQDVCEFLLDREKWFAGDDELHAATPYDLAEPFERGTGDPFNPPRRGQTPEDPMSIHGFVGPALKSCAVCHQGPGVYSILSMQRVLQDDRPANPRVEVFRTFDRGVVLSEAVREKARRFDWGLLQGMLEADGLVGAAATRPAAGG